ncbi:MAG: PLP-dependent transferase, partial [Cyclobacteriaceae bacterium]|nr:PLP-dependent transferase [Cyclobacteriaceae bacterium]
KVDKVYWPGFESHPGHDVAKSQMSGFGGMISFTVKGDKQDAFSIMEKFKLFTIAESLGGVESLCNHPVSMTHGSVPKEKRDILGITDNLVRLSVGIEDAEDLLEDLKQALG